MLPASQLGKACDYALGQWAKLEVYVRKGDLEIDDNWYKPKFRGDGQPQATRRASEAKRHATHRPKAKNRDASRQSRKLADHRRHPERHRPRSARRAQRARPPQRSFRAPMRPELQHQRANPQQLEAHQPQALKRTGNMRLTRLLRCLHSRLRYSFVMPLSCGLLHGSGTKSPPWINHLIAFTFGL